ncbi:hypothetical protein [Thermococcus stetteri]|uniref:hypothetical protein n=1 Tax=Thermococcus stetteri TaxID=49900 RepID=UPI001AEA508A|nr:hypothetical protein [Thermococcus stetteri]MBP1911399.1 hypothetical protein [Thermococcus stetteri]
MKRALPALFLLIMLAGSVSAAGVSYYPDKEAFMKFLDSNLTYQIVPGNDPWSKGWAIYVDEKLSRIKGHGNDTIVLVGNVYTNDLIAEVWNQTGLDPSASLTPSIIVLNDTVLITGSSENLYLTYEPFVGIKMNSVKIAITIMGVVYVILMMIILKRDGSYAGSMFLMGSLLLGEWALLEPLSAPFLSKTLYLSLARLNGAPTNDVSIVVVSHILEILPPDEVLFWAVRWLLVFFLLGATTYTAHRRERSLGIVAFFLVLSAPLFRKWLLTSNEILGLLSFAVVVAIVCSSNFAPSSSGVASVLMMSLFTVLGMVFNPYLVFLPLVFLVVFPGRTTRNASYLLLSAIGILLIYLSLGNSWVSPWHPDELNSKVLIDIVREGLLQLVVLVYVGARMIARRNDIKIRRKGPTVFVGTVTVILLLLTPIESGLLPYSLFSLSILAARLIRTSPQI